MQGTTHTLSGSQ